MQNLQLKFSGNILGNNFTFFYIYYPGQIYFLGHKEEKKMKILRKVKQADGIEKQTKISREFSQPLAQKVIMKHGLKLKQKQKEPLKVFG